MIVQAAYPSLPKVLQLPAHPRPGAHQGPPSLWGQQNLQASQLPGLFYFIPGLLDSLFLPLANPCLSHLHRVLCLITTYLPNIFSHTTTNTENLQLLYMGNYPNHLLKKIILTHLDTIQLTMRIKQGITSKILLTLVTSQGFEGIKTVLVGTNK